jgi:uncharacterized LabA/DUF88 family protein
MKRTAICVDAGYLFAQGSTALTGSVKPRNTLAINAPAVLTELKAVATAKAAVGDILRCYWYDGAVAFKGPTLEQEQLAHLDSIKLRLGYINSVGQQKGVDSLIVTDLIELARLGAICDAVLLSGDEDVRVGVQIAQSYGVRIHLVGIVPSRGSQSKALLQEADTTTEWSTATVAKFLSIRSVPAIATPTVIIPPSGTQVSGPIPPTAQPASANAQLEKNAQDFAVVIDDADVKSLVEYWGTQKGVPPEFDGKLLAKSRAEIGRDLNAEEKRFSRRKFIDAVRAKAAKL